MTKRLKRNIQIIVETVRTKYYPEKIILFGSATRGEFVEGSDLDFFIIKQTDLPRHRRSIEIFRLLREIDRNYPVDFIVYTPKELKNCLALGDFFIQNIIEEGKIIV